MRQWQWDAARGDYCYFSPEENVYVYQSGARVTVSGTNQNVGATDTYTATQEYELFVGIFVEQRAEPGTFLIGRLLNHRVTEGKELVSRIAVREQVNSQIAVLNTHNMRGTRLKDMATPT